MDFLQKIGGRKFVLGLLAMGVATFLELQGHGLTTTMEGFLLGVVGLFHAANYLNTSKHMDSKANNISRTSEIVPHIETLSKKIDASNDPQMIAQLVDLLTNISTKTDQIENVSRQMGTGMVNLGNQVSILSKRLQ